MRLQVLAFLIFPLLSLASVEDQMVISGKLPGGEETYTPQSQSQPALADLLTIESSASIFYSYARETELSALFDDESARVTLLVPTNKAVMALARKPHEGPAPIDEGVILSEQEFDVLSKENVLRWVSAHIIPHSPISLLSPSTHETMLEGKNVSFESVSGDDSAPEWTRVRMDGDVRLTGLKEASNGIMYILDGTVSVE